MELKPEKISEMIRSQIKYYQNAIIQNETGVIFDDAVDVEGATFTYSETETNLPGENDEQG